MSGGFSWSGGSPSTVLGAGLERYLEQIRQAVLDAAAEIAAELERDAQATAPWTDRTGNARKGLTGAVDVAGDLVAIYLSHTVSYGVFLELARGGKYAVIMPTIERALPRVFERIAARLPR